MAKAFECDTCSRLETGEPDQSLTVKPTNGATVDLQLCSVCLVSFNDWRVLRAPEQDKPGSY